MSGKGGIACTHPLSVGLFGRYSRIANELIEASDCLLVVGCKLGEIATKRYALPSGRSRLIHLDIVAEEIGRCLPAEVALWGDARAGLEDLAEALAEDAGTPAATRADYVAEIPKRMAAWRDEARPRIDSDERPIHMARLCRELNTCLAGREHPRRRWRVCRALDRAPLRYENRRSAFHPGPRPGFDRLWAARRDRGRARGARQPRSSRSPAMAAST